MSFVVSKIRGHSWLIIGISRCGAVIDGVAVGDFGAVFTHFFHKGHDFGIELFCFTNGAIDLVARASEEFGECGHANGITALARFVFGRPSVHDEQFIIFQSFKIVSDGLAERVVVRGLRSKCFALFDGFGALMGATVGRCATKVFSAGHTNANRFLSLFSGGCSPRDEGLSITIRYNCAVFLISKELLKRCPTRRATLVGPAQERTGLVP